MRYPPCSTCPRTLARPLWLGLKVTIGKYEVQVDKFRRYLVAGLVALVGLGLGLPLTVTTRVGTVISVTVSVWKISFLFLTE